MQRVGSTASGASISTSSSLWGNAVPFVLCVSLTVIIDVRAALQAGQLSTLFKTGSFPPLYTTRIIRMSWCAISSQLFSLQIFQVLQVFALEDIIALSFLAPSIVGVATSSFPLR